MDETPAELLKSILNAAERHPNAKVSKLIKCFEVDKTSQNIALLLIELAEHAEFSADISISLKYYLDCFRELRQEPSFAEAGIVLFNSSKIYAKRVDHIHHEIERLILSLSNVENIEQNASSPDLTQNTTAKEKRGRKRPLEQINSANEVNMNAKRFKKLTNNKRFESVTPKRNNLIKTSGQDSDKSMKNYIPQSTWQYSAIEDFDYEDEVDSKKNYKLFTYHLEHRYNTLIPDINFKMYFKIKDLINGDCNDSALPESWPPLSDAYIEQFLDLEDVILLKEGHMGKTREKMDTSRFKDACGTNFGNSNSENCNNSITTMDSGIGFDDVNSSVDTTGSQIQQMESQTSLSEINCTSKSLDSGIGSEASIQSQTIDDSQIRLLESNRNIGESLNISESGIGSDISSISPEMDQKKGNDLSAVRKESDEESVRVTENDLALLDSSKLPEENVLTVKIIPNEDAIKTTQNDPTLLDSSRPPEADLSAVKNTLAQSNEEATKANEKDPTLLDPSINHKEDLSTLKIILPHLADEGIFFSDLDDRDRKMLSPAVVAQDVFGCIKDKSNIVIKVDDAIEQLFKIREPSDEFLSLPLYERPHFVLQFNILKIPLKYFNKQRTFKLRPEFDILKKDRLKKYLKRSSVLTSSTPKKCERIDKKIFTREHISPPSTPSYEPDWLGFPEDPEETSMDKNRTLSRDSGISLPQADRENIEDFVGLSDLLSSTMKPIALQDEGSTENQEILIPDPGTPITPIPAPTTNIPDELPVSLENPSISSAEAPNPPVEDVVVEQSNEKSNNNVSMDHQSSELDELNEENRVRTKVHAWHSHLQPILACSRERHHFDVFALGTEIMTQFDRSNLPNEKVSFKNVMEEKEESLISRYFLSMLLLANQGNILIDVQNKSINEPSDLHDIRLKLISRKRNIVSLEDNIGLRTPPASTTHIDDEQQHVDDAFVRTLKSVAEVPKMDDRDSGVAMSEVSTS